MDTLHIHTRLPESEGAPEWVHLLPAGSFRGDDGRGPYRVADANALIAHSMQVTGGKLPIDENHATDFAQRTGGSAPAVGWITGMEARADGIWGRVDWTRSGRALVEDRAYRGLSPAFRAPGGKVTSIERASLTNAPNISALTQLHMKEPDRHTMDIADLRRRLGLPDNATEADIGSALERARDALTLHSRIAEIAGVEASASADALITGLRSRASDVQTHAREVETLRGQVETLQKDGRKQLAEHFIESVARERFVTDEGRTDLLELHMENPERAERLAKSFPERKPGLETHTRRAGVSSTGEDELVAAAARAWGQNPDDVRKTMKGAA